MDSVFVIADQVPTNLTKYEMVLEHPMFMEEIRACEKKRGGAHLVGSNYLRSIAEEIGRKYDKTFNPYRHVVPSDYHGVSCQTLEEVATLVQGMFRATYPKIFDSYYEYRIKSRPFDVRVVYLIDDAVYATTATRCGLKQISKDQIEDHLGFKKDIVTEVESVVTAPIITQIQSETVPVVEVKLEAQIETESESVVPEITLIQTKPNSLLEELANDTSVAQSQPIETSVKKTKIKKNKYKV